MAKIRFILLAILAALSLQAQGFRYMYAAGRDVASGTSNVFTVQMPANATRTFRGVAASVTCGAACDIQVERDGTLATTTAATVVKNNPEDPTAQALAFHTSNVGSGTAIPGPDPMPSAGKAKVDLKEKRLLAGQTLTIRVTSATSTRLTINMFWEEF